MHHFRMVVRWAYPLPSFGSDLANVHFDPLPMRLRFHVSIYLPKVSPKKGETT